MAAGVTVHIDVRDVLGKIDHLIDQVKDQRSMWDDIGFELVKSVDENFKSEGRPKWAEWSPAYAAGVPKGNKILTGSGDLRRSISHEADDRGVDVGTNLVYAAIHQFGGKTKPHEIRARFKKALAFGSGGDMIFRKRVQHPGSKIPARPYLMLQDEDYAKIIEIIEDHITEGW